MKYFFAVSYSSQVDTRGKVFPQFRQEIENILTALESDDSKAYCAPRNDGWKLNDLSPSEAVALDLKNIDDSDIFIALLEEVISAGVQLELGYALAQGKKLLIAVKEDRNLSYVNRGLISAGKASLVIYETPQDIVDGLSKVQSDHS